MKRTIQEERGKRCKNGMNDALQTPCFHCGSKERCGVDPVMLVQKIQARELPTENNGSCSLSLNVKYYKCS